MYKTTNEKEYLTTLLDLFRYSDLDDEVKTKLINNNSISTIDFKDINLLLTDKLVRQEVGYIKVDNHYQLAMYTEMPNVTKEMINWWFWWHPQENIRYKVWCPNSHKSIGYHKKDKSYFEQTKIPPFSNNTQYPVEVIDGKTMKLRIDFMSPSEFGFDESLFNKNNVETVICGNVSLLNGLIPNTKLIHIFFKTESGLLLVSRFYFGKELKSNFLKKFLNDKLAFEMTKHINLEFSNLAFILPNLYEKYNKHD